ncbi:propionyl-coenzyme A carboxylase alpha polypeptide [Rhizobium wuzhouense]|uniref:Propionyl-coenzyme A carboxylase alpha polypeptide n=1 Tax=Rhizobium wuzhouense TaxID=1986026 RepID=A0ABX5NWG8_9HYPH|nr:propionyl-coenzyme A carboxylase alpha polypeptide [Rhizobium wuzhouense]
MSDVAVWVPPSGLPAISPSRGEIDMRPVAHVPISRGWGTRKFETHSAVRSVYGTSRLPISPLEGEMPGRAEGGVAPCEVIWEPASC